MANLPAIVRATRASASALARMQYAARRIRTARWQDDKAQAENALARATRAYERAQLILANNPI